MDADLEWAILLAMKAVAFFLSAAGAIVSLVALGATIRWAALVVANLARPEGERRSVGFWMLP